MFGRWPRDGWFGDSGQWRVDLGWFGWLRERERENRDMLFLLGRLYYFNMLYSKIKTEMVGEL